jgi:hypothetical protein
MTSNIETQPTDSKKDVPSHIRDVNRQVIENFKKRRSRTTFAHLKVNKDRDKAAIAVEPEGLLGQLHLLDAFATADADFRDGIVQQLTTASSWNGVPQETELNFMLAVIKSMEARDHIEVMLGAQMAAVHASAMRIAGHLKNELDFVIFSKLTRSFASQMEALSRYRRGGEQRVTVQHVSVSESSQATVGNAKHARPPRNRPASVGAPPQRPRKILPFRSSMVTNLPHPSQRSRRRS